MKNKIKSSLLLIKYEFLKIFRNKVFLGFLLFFPIIFLSFLGTINAQSKYSCCIYTDGVAMEDVKIIDLITYYIDKDAITEVSSIDNGIDNILNGTSVFFICVDASVDPINTKIYYDNSSLFIANSMNYIENAKNKYTYQELTKFLETYGVTINEDYFNIVTLTGISEEKISQYQILFPVELALLLAIVICFGIAYSVVRDTENGTLKYLRYTPLKPGNYMLSKTLPYFGFFLLQTFFLLLLGAWLFDLNYGVKFIWLLLLCILFGINLIFSSLIFCQVKNQISAVGLILFQIIFPIFVLMTGVVQNYPLIIQGFLQLMPVTHFILVFKSLLLNDYLIVYNFIMLLVLPVVYFVIDYFLIKNRLNK